MSVHRPLARAVALLLALAVLAPPTGSAGDASEAPRTTANRLAEEGRLADALPLFDRAVHATPRDPTLRAERGMCRLGLGRTADALADFDAALSLAPRHPQAHYGRGVARYLQGDLPGARADADAALAADPALVGALTLRGEIRRAQGDLRGALADLREARRLAPDLADLVRSIEALEAELARGHAAPLDDPPPRPPPPRKAPAPAPAPPPPPSVGATRTFLTEVPDEVSAPAPPDPLDPAAEPHGDVLWAPPPAAPARPATTTLPVDVPSRLSWTAFDPMAYAAAVTAAREGLRLLQGPMTPEEHRRYEEKWLAYEAWPTPEILDYFAALLPLLERWLAARAGFTAAAQAAAAALLEAGAFEATGDAAGFDAALWRARARTRDLEAYRTALERLATEIEALGNPPSPYAALRRRRAAYDEALAALTPPAPLVWVLRESEALTPMGQAFPTGAGAAHGDGYATAVRTETTPIARTLTATAWRWHVPRVVPFAQGRPEAKPGTPGFAATIPVEIGAGWTATLVEPVTAERRRDYGVPTGLRLPMLVGRPRALYPEATEEIAAAIEPDAGHGRFGPPDPRVARPTSWSARVAGEIPVVRLAQAAPRDRSQRIAERMAMGMRLRPGLSLEIGPDEEWRRGEWDYLGQGRYELVVCVVLPGLVHHYRYALRPPDDEEVARVEAEGARVERISRAVYEEFVARHRLDAPVQPALVLRRDEATAAARPEARPPTPAGAKSPEDLAAEQARREAIEFQQASIRYFEEVLRRDRAEHDAMADEAGRRDLRLRLLATEAHLQAARDHLTRLTTGAWVHTRTAYDDVNAERMLEIAREEAARLAVPDRLREGLEAQIALLPESERGTMRDLVWGRLGTDPVAWRDPAALRSALADVAERVRARWSQEAADQAFVAKVARGMELGLEGTKIVSGLVLLGAGGYGVSALGASSVELFATETLLGAAYGGAQGYVEGGVVEASRQSLQWAGMVGFVASEAIEGYRETGTVQGAGDRAGKAYLLGKALEMGVRWGAGFLGRRLSGAPAAPPAAEVALFREQMAQGERLVRAAAQSEWAVAEALSRGAPTSTVEALSLDARRAALAVQSSWCAKILLKRQGVTVSSVAIGERVGGVVRESLDEVNRRLSAMGYGEAEALRWRLVTNPKKSGAFGMDYDLGLVETPGMVLTKNGRRVSLQTLHTDAQRAMDAAWQGRTGWTAEQSSILMTTTQHHEAFSTRMLRSRVPFESLTRADVHRAADVLRSKVSEIALPPMQRRVEQARTLAKEMETKVLPYLDQRLARATAAGDAKTAAGLTRVRGTWEGIRRRAVDIGRRETDPGRLWRLCRDWEVATGGKTIEEVAHDLANSLDMVTSLVDR